MKKKLLIFLSLLMLSISLVGCWSDEKPTEHIDGHRVVHIGDREFIRVAPTCFPTKT